MKKYNINKSTKEDFLGGMCVSFVTAHKEIFPEAEIATVYDNGIAIHLITILNKQIADITGEWDSEDEYLENLKSEFEEIFPDDSWGDFEIIYHDQSHQFYAIDDDEKNRAINIIKGETK